MATLEASQELSPKQREELGRDLQREGVVIHTFDLWKTYIMGDQEIHAVFGRRYRDPTW